MRIDRRLVLSIVLFLASSGAAWGIGVFEYVLPAGNDGPTGIAVGADGALWFTAEGTNKIGRITTTGTITEFAVPTPNSAPVGIVAGPDGALWFTELVGNQLGRITTDGALSEYSVPTPGSHPQGITVGPDGAIWFTELASNKIGRISPGGIFTEFPLASAAGPLFIITGPDGALWFTESAAAGNKIGRITTKGVITEFAVPTANSEPYGITVGPDGALWFTERMAKKIGRITTAGEVSELPTLGPGFGIVTGPDGNLWFTEPDSAKLSSLSTAGSVTEVTLPTANAGPQGITVGPDGGLWFAEGSVGQIGHASFACTPNGTTLCLDDQAGDRRWQLNLTFNTADGGGHAGNGNAIPLAGLGVARGGLFWFFSAGNPEMLVKLLDACSLNQQFWVFAAATTNAGFTLTVIDTRTGRVKAYTNRDGTAAPPVQDTSAFACTNGDAAPRSEPAGKQATASERAPDLGPASPALFDAAAAGVSEPGTASAVNVSEPGPAGAADISELEADAAGVWELAPISSTDAAACSSSSTAVCIDGRFLLAVTYRAGHGHTGPGQAIPLQTLGVAQGGLFWFFSADNPEMLIKVLDGCGVNRRFWIFYAAGTNVGFTVTVTDTQTGMQKTYTNALGTAAPPVQDTSALPCP
jgi:virginiamycin B lyase